MNTRTLDYIIRQRWTTDFEVVFGKADTVPVEFACNDILDLLDVIADLRRQLADLRSDDAAFAWDSLSDRPDLSPGQASVLAELPVYRPRCETLRARHCADELTWAEELACCIHDAYVAEDGEEG